MDDTPIRDDPKRPPGQVATADDIALGDDGLYWVTSTMNEDGTCEKWLERRRWTATASETLAPGVPGLVTERIVVDRGQVFGYALPSFCEIFSLWSWLPNEARVVVVANDIANLLGTPSTLPMDDAFIYYSPRGVAELRRLPRAGGSSECA